MPKDAASSITRDHHFIKFDLLMDMVATVRLKDSFMSINSTPTSSVSQKMIPVWLSDGISTMQWPVDADSYPPLHFKSLEEMRNYAWRNVSIEAIVPCSGLSSFSEFVSHLPKSLEKFLNADSDGDARYFSLVAIALVLLGNGYTDEAHALVAPLSYPQELPFGYDPSGNAYSSVSEDARSYASYAHSLVHRREGPNVGEFRLTGFANARYWSSIVLCSPGAESLPGNEIRDAILKLASETFSHSPTVQQWIAQHFATQPVDESYFEARPLHELCEMVLQQNGSDKELSSFCQQATEREARILLAHALQKAGFDVSNMTMVD